MFETITIVGLGLMGTSLARDIQNRQLSQKVIGIDHCEDNLNFVLKNKWITESSTDVMQALQQSDAVILAMPVAAIEEFLKKWGAFISENTLVMDIGSTKIDIIKAAENHLKFGQFVGCHPMAGTENAGPQKALVDLFKNQPCFLVKAKNTSQIFFEQAKKFWQALDANIAIEVPEEHDQVMAMISHLPQLIASLLSVSVLEDDRLDLSPSVKNSCRTFLGQGFKDMIRIASSPHEMWRDIFLKNSKYLLHEIKRFQKELHHIEQSIAEQDENALADFMKLGARLRKEI